MTGLSPAVATVAAALPPVSRHRIGWLARRHSVKTGRQDIQPYHDGDHKTP